MHQGVWPEGINAPTQYGPRAKAFVVHLNQDHLVPLKRTCALMRDAFALNLSQASVQAFCQEAAQTLEPTVATIGQAVQGAPVVHADETGVRVQGKLHWLHCAVISTLTWLGFRTVHGADTFFTIRSYLTTMQKQGACLFHCLVSTFSGQPIQPRWAG